MPNYRGLTWDHPRGRDALEASSPHRIEGSESWVGVEWDVHSLAGFESRPISEIAREYDLVVLDHPHLGDALASGSLQPLDSIFATAELEMWGRGSVGPSMDSYRMDGHVWALPIDAATQVAAGLSDKLGEFPQTWGEVDALSRSGSVALSLSGPHAVVTFASTCIALGEEPATGEDYMSIETGSAAFDLLAGVAGRAPRGAADLDPIDLLTRMAEVGDIHYVPLVFGYVTFATAPTVHRISFGDAPSAAVGGRRGSTIGGAGIAVTQRCETTPELKEYLRWLMSADAQERFIPLHNGQPSARSAWTSPDLNAVHGDFYSATLATVEDSWVRPRYAGYVGFQLEASEVVRGIVHGETSPARGTQEINTLHRRYSAAALEGAVS